jgi:hypothetical protein
MVKARKSTKKLENAKKENRMLISSFSLVETLIPRQVSNTANNQSKGTNCQLVQPIQPLLIGQCSPQSIVLAHLMVLISS